MEWVGEIRFWVPKRSGTERLRTKGKKDRDPRVGGKRSAATENDRRRQGKRGWKARLGPNEAIH